jgi:hypothetical protein
MKRHETVQVYLTPHKINAFQSMFALPPNVNVLHGMGDPSNPGANYTAGNAQGLDYFGMLQTRTFGFILRATF